MSELSEERHMHQRRRFNLLYAASAFNFHSESIFINYLLSSIYKDLKIKISRVELEENGRRGRRASSEQFRQHRWGFLAEKNRSMRVKPNLGQIRIEPAKIWGT